MSPEACGHLSGLVEPQRLNPLIRQRRRLTLTQAPQLGRFFQFFHRCGRAAASQTLPANGMHTVCIYPLFC